MSHVSNGRFSKSTLLFLLGAACLFGYAQFLLWKDWNFDDGYIVYRIVRTILDHGEWAYNLGERHNASTSVLNTLLTALGALLARTTPVPVVAHALQTLWLILGALATMVLLSRHLHPLWAIGAGLSQIIFLSSNATWGLECHLFCALLLWAVVATPGSLMRWALLGLLVLSRPDGLLFVTILYCAESLAARRVRLRPPVVLVAILLPWIAYSLVTFGEVFPDTLHAKMWQGSSGLWGRSPVFLRGLGAHLLDHSWITRLWLLWGLGGAIFIVRRALPLWPLMVYAVLHLGAYSVLNVPGYHWYYVSFDLALFLAGWVALGTLLGNATGALRMLKNEQLLAAGAIVCGLAWIALTPEGRERDGRDLAYRASLASLTIPFAPEDTLATLEVGTIGYVLPHRIVDLAGLASPNPEYLSGRHSEHFLGALPKYLLLHNPTWHFESALHDDPRFSLLYVAKSQTPPGAYGLTLFERGENVSLGTREQVSQLLEAKFPPLRSFSPFSPAADRESLSFLCILDQLNGRMKAPGVVDLNYNLIAVRGWAADRSFPTPPEETFLVLSEESSHFAFSLRRTERPDIVAHLQTDAFIMAGYEGTATLATVPAGRYHLSVVERHGPVWRQCPLGQEVQVLSR